MTGIAAKRSADTANRRCAGKAITPQELLLNSLKAGERVEWWVLALLVYQKSNKCSIHLLDKSLSGRRKNMKKVPLPEWCVSVKKAMVERDDMSVTELAKEIGYSRAHVSQVINGTMVPSANIKSAIESCLNLRA
ncbi:helix-turn-helix domain-containing protein [Faecalibacterium sp. I4-1-79]|jgi:DNA-binding XRE family transcriptional regulator|uniref:helix-turn-helix domain-containing protein n=1 Tax=Faecalibacterium sp. I4-1-79 TaxID=2929494 RepID=UPI0011CA67DB|nr:helix-turn-helix transcriptional regulator [Faecalibacterium sp. I4-1-79]UQK38765.1 helix-turn-helix transcriptional regulator [Faecalibacterium sp. I4-1-79]